MTLHEVEGFDAYYGGFISVEELNAPTRIYAQGENIVVETPVDTIVEIIMTNVMSRTMTATAGRNVYPASKGINIVRVDGKVSKLSL